MSINTVISEALSTLGLPVAFNVYQGAEKRHIVFNYFTTPDDFGDDAPGCEIYHVQVHFYGPYGSNDAAYFRGIKKNLHDAGFTWPEMQDVSDRDGNHFVFECQYSDEVG